MLKHIILFVILGANFMTAKNETIILGAGCFWCVEAIYERIDGVISVEAGYANGYTENPTYNDVCNGNTGYAEVAKIAFDPQKVSFTEILDIFWKAHDPTTLNRQGADVGNQYRSGIYFQSETQKEIAEKSLSNAQNTFKNKIVTEIEPLKKYYIAEDYHQNYYDNNKNAPYCSFVIAPKLKKLNLAD
jgi:peptide-methionine (S)-S-oxide reductase